MERQFKAKAASARRADAVRRARSACRALEELGVKVKVFGSLAGESFGPWSDIDLLVADCPRALKYSIEGMIEDRLGGFPFDLVYLDEVPEYKRARFMAEAVDARDIR